MVQRISNCCYFQSTTGQNLERSKKNFSNINSTIQSLSGEKEIIITGENLRTVIGNMKGKSKQKTPKNMKKNNYY